MITANFSVIVAYIRTEAVILQNFHVREEIFCHETSRDLYEASDTQKDHAIWSFSYRHYSKHVVVQTASLGLF